MSKGITITSTILSIFLLTLLTIGLQNNDNAVFAQESEIETVNATGAQQQESGAQAGNATGAQQQESAAQAGNATSNATATKEKPDAATISIGKSFAQQGTLTSIQDPLPGHEGHQIAIILPPRDDSAIYEGTLTFTSSKPTEVVILQNFANETNVDAFYGGVATAPLGEGTVAISLLTPQFGPIASASIPFAGNALALHNIEGEPFAATYTVSGSVDQAQTFNSIMPPPLTEATEEEEAGAADGGDGDGDGGDGDGNGGDGDGNGGDGDGNGGDGDGDGGDGDGDGEN
jgi:hypothetical protein